MTLKILLKNFMKFISITVGCLLIVSCMTTGLTNKSNQDDGIYVGDLRDGKRHGFGTITWKDGVQYVGEFKNGKRYGKGKFTYADGSTFSGEYRDDLANGMGTRTYPNGAISTGEYKDNKPTGRVKCTWPNGISFTSQHTDFDKNIIGEYSLADGATFSGRLEISPYVCSVFDDQNADISGLKKGDIITHYNEVRLYRGPRQLSELTHNTKPNTKVPISILRNDVKKDLNLDGGWIGIGISPVPTVPTKIQNIATINSDQDTNITAKEIEFSKTDTHSDSIAVIIGNQNYDNKDIPEVAYAKNDADAMKKYLIETLGYKDGNIIYHIDPSKANLEMIFGIKGNYKGILYDYLKPNKSDVFIYYSGHGAPDTNTKEAYFVPSNGNPSKIAFTGYPLAIFYENISQLPAKKITVVIDACFSGGTNSGRWIVSNASPALIKISNPSFAKGNISVLTSSESSQISSWYPDQRHGLFTFFFLKAINGEADKNKDRKITFNEIYKYVSDRTEGVPYWAKRLHGGRIQNPTMQTANKDAVFVKY